MAEGIVSASLKKTYMLLDGQGNHWAWEQGGSEWVLSKAAPGVTNPKPPKDPPAEEQEDFDETLVDIIKKTRPGRRP